MWSGPPVPTIVAGRPSQVGTDRDSAAVGKARRHRTAAMKRRRRAIGDRIERRPVGGRRGEFLAYQAETEPAC
jgi:hypothetical protein